MSSSGTTVTEISTPFSAGGDGGTANKPMEDETIDSCPFRVGEGVLAFHSPRLYDAKKWVEETVSELQFGLHIYGAIKKKSLPLIRFVISTVLLISGSLWDAWLGVNCILKHTEENVRKQEQLKKEHGPERRAKLLGRLSQDKTKVSVGVRGKKRERQIIEKLVKLPRSPCAYEILNKYFDYWVMKDGMIVKTAGEFVNGLRCYFNKALPAMLLYKEEHQQYNEVIVDNVAPSGVYGAEHLLRLFVKLPEMLSRMHIDMETSAELHHRLHDFLRFLQSNQSAFFHSNYQSSEGFVDTVKKEEE
ncbi:hypothetical protein OROHE_023384 [Orobanche hederae]